MVAYFFLIIAQTIVNLLPRSVALDLGRFLGNLWYFVDARHRHVAKRNLIMAFGQEMDHGQICRLTRSSFRHMGAVFTDTLRMGKYVGLGNSAYFNTEGGQYIDEAVRMGKGLLIPIPHFGNWEMLSLLGKIFKRPVSFIAREIENPYIERHTFRTRQLTGMRVIDKKNAARRILSCLRDNQCVSVTMDQNAGRNGTYVDFFGRKASTHTTVAAFARRTGAPILIAHSLMTDDGRYRFIFEKPTGIVATDDTKQDIVTNTAVIMRRFEEIIRRTPEQYFWVHQRWKPIQNEFMRREFRRVENIVIKAPNWIGDVVMSLPAISYVRKVFPEARIKVLIKEHLADLVRYNPDIDDIMTYRLRKGPARVIDEWRIIRRIRREYFNLAIVLPYSISSALWTYLAGVPLRLGSAVRRRGGILTHTVTPPRSGEHQLDYFLRIVQRLGTKKMKPGPRIEVGDHDKRKALEIVREFGPKKSVVVGIHPGAAYGPAKRWLPERFAELAGRLNKEGINVVVFGAASEGNTVEEIVSQTNGTVTNLCGKLSLAEFVAMLKQCDVVVTNDSGPMHLAGAAGTSVVAIFGSTSPDATSPTGECEIIWKNVDCSPCFRRECQLDLKCMREITTDEVYTAVKKMLKRGDAE